MDITWFSFVLVFMAAIAAGIINAVAGGGTLVTFPALTAIGIPPVVANVTNTVALCFGLLSGTYAQRKDFQAQKKRLWKILPVGIAGGIAGGLILLNTTESAFEALIPYLILIATILLALQVPVKNWVTSRLAHHNNKLHNPAFKYILIFLAAIYGGYFWCRFGNYFNGCFRVGNRRFINEPECAETGYLIQHQLCRGYLFSHFR